MNPGAAQPKPYQLLLGEFKLIQQAYLLWAQEDKLVKVIGLDQHFKCIKTLALWSGPFWPDFLLPAAYETILAGKATLQEAVNAIHEAADKRLKLLSCIDIGAVQLQPLMLPNEQAKFDAVNANKKPHLIYSGIGADKSDYLYVKVTRQGKQERVITLYEYQEEAIENYKQHLRTLQVFREDLQKVDNKRVASFDNYIKARLGERIANMVIGTEVITVELNFVLYSDDLNVPNIKNLKNILQDLGLVANPTKKTDIATRLKSSQAIADADLVAWFNANNTLGENFNKNQGDVKKNIVSTQITRIPNLAKSDTEDNSTIKKSAAANASETLYDDFCAEYKGAMIALYEVIVDANAPAEIADFIGKLLGLDNVSILRNMFSLLHDQAHPQGYIDLAEGKSIIYQYVYSPALLRYLAETLKVALHKGLKGECPILQAEAASKPALLNSQTILSTLSNLQNNDDRQAFYRQLKLVNQACHMLRAARDSKSNIDRYDVNNGTISAVCSDFNRDYRKELDALFKQVKPTGGGEAVFAAIPDGVFDKIYNLCQQELGHTLDIAAATELPYNAMKLSVAGVNDMTARIKHIKGYIGAAFLIEPTKEQLANDIKGAKDTNALEDILKRRIESTIKENHTDKTLTTIRQFETDYDIKVLREGQKNTVDKIERNNRQARIQEQIKAHSYHHELWFAFTIISFWGIAELAWISYTCALAWYQAAVLSGLAVLPIVLIAIEIMHYHYRSPSQVTGALHENSHNNHTPAKLLAFGIIIETAIALAPLMLPGGYAFYMPTMTALAHGAMALSPVPLVLVTAIILPILVELGFAIHAAVQMWGPAS